MRVAGAAFAVLIALGAALPALALPPAPAPNVSLSCGLPAPEVPAWAGDTDVQVASLHCDNLLPGKTEVGNIVVGYGGGLEPFTDISGYCSTRGVGTATSGGGGSVQWPYVALRSIYRPGLGYLRLRYRYSISKSNGSGVVSITQNGALLWGLEARTDGTCRYLHSGQSFSCPGGHGGEGELRIGVPTDEWQMLGFGASGAFGCPPNTSNEGHVVFDPYVFPDPEETDLEVFTVRSLTDPTPVVPVEGSAIFPADFDGDGYPWDVDCDISRASVNPGAAEVCDDLLDNDCDGYADSLDTDCGCADADLDGVCDVIDNCAVPNPDQTDADGDGFGALCDCDDGNDSVNPDQEEICGDFVDNDCSGAADDSPDVNRDGLCDACGDGADNDGDGLTDYPADPGCGSSVQAGEDPECQDGVDNDSDSYTDYPDDPGCLAPQQISESPQCDDGVDNDADGKSDAADPGCMAAYDNAELSQCDDGVDNDSDGRFDFLIAGSCVTNSSGSCVAGSGSDCCEARAVYAPGCGDAACEATVCAANPGCCSAVWHGGCALLAQQLCGGLCDGSCSNDASITCSWSPDCTVRSCAQNASLRCDADSDCADPGCAGAWDNSETRTRSCGIGAELVLALVPLAWLMRRRRGR